jgi:hypothetical protein
MAKTILDHDEVIAALIIGLKTTRTWDHSKQNASLSSTHENGKLSLCVEITDKDTRTDLKDQTTKATTTKTTKRKVDFRL